MPPPLAHLRVVDLTDLRGAFAGRLLADLGADVVKVEPPRGDAGRFVPPFAGDVAAPDRSLPFLYRNANKRGAVLDLHQAGGWHRFGTLCEQADILIENLGPEGERRHGLTPAEVQERHPHLVHVALADFGLTGPRAGWRLEALPAFAASGALHASGFPDRPPCWLPGYAAHDCGATFAVAGALAAVLARARSGAGQTVEVSVQEAALNGMNPWSIPPADSVRGYFQQTGFPHLGDAPFAPAPFNFSRTPAVLGRPAPAPGAASEGSFPPRAPGRPGGDGTQRPALAGLRVIDLGCGVAIPETGTLLAELGAEVIKIESRANIDFLRRVTVEPDAVDRSWTFNDASRGQLSVALDLRTPRGRELALRLCAAADVVIENNRGDVVRKWGLDYEDVRRVRPDVVYLASQGFGRGGPLGEASAYGPLNSAFAGVTWLWNHPDAPYPAGSSLNHPDHIAAKLTAVAVLAALEHRRRTGEGQLIEMSQAEAAAYLIGEVYLEGPCTGRPAAQRGNAVLYACPHGVYPSAGDDRWVAIAVVGDEAWERFAGVLGWPLDPALASLDGRLAARAALDRRVAEWTRARSAEEAAAALQAAGVSAVPVENGDDHRADPHLAARGAIVTVEHPEIGPERHSGNPIRLSLTPRSATPSSAGSRRAPGAAAARRRSSCSRRPRSRPARPRRCSSTARARAASSPLTAPARTRAGATGSGSAPRRSPASTSGTSLTA